MKRSYDAVLLVLLVVARARIDTLADLVLPNRQHDFAQAPLLAALVPEAARARLADWLTDPLGLLLLSLSFGALLAYLLVDQAAARLGAQQMYRVKLALIGLLVVLQVVAPTLKLVLLRRVGGPASYTHDGGVIQTEETIKLLWQGRNPYVEDYVDTPLAEWGLDLHSAVYHYPYLPWTFLFSAPFERLSQWLLGWYDQRFVYLLLYALMLWLAPALARSPTHKLALVMTLALNPMMGTDILFGQNDVFILAWVVISLWLAQQRRLTLAAAVFGLACASKPTAWFLAPFLALVLAGDETGTPRAWLARAVGRMLPAAAVFAVLMLPYIVWDVGALVDDVWRWSSGTADVPYQMRGWGFANFVLAFGGVTSRLDYWPFWLLQLLVCAPLLGWLLWRQRHANHLAAAMWHYGLLLFAFFYFSRFLNENYLGYITALLAVGWLAHPDD